MLLPQASSSLSIRSGSRLVRFRFGVVIDHPKIEHTCDWGLVNDRNARPSADLLRFSSRYR